MAEETVELIFGMKAGQVWEALYKKGPSSIDSIADATGMQRELVYGALGWLGREGKIGVERRGRAMIFSLRESEALISTGISAAQEQPAPAKRRGPNKTKKARKAKSSASSPESLVKALDFIRSEFEANREPTPTQVSKIVGMDSRQLGIALSKLGIKSKSIRLEGRSARIYPLDLKAKVEELAALDAEGLIKESNQRAGIAENI